MEQRVIAEIVGPAGAGKSTLARALRERDGQIRTGLSVWGLPPHLLAVNAFLSLPILVGLYRGGRRLRLDEINLIVRLNALHQLLGRKSLKRKHKALLLDEGTVFALVKLHAFGREGAAGESGRLDRWTRGLLRRWAERLDAVIWLDAPDEILARRIRERDKPHRVKGASDEEIYAFLARYRASYEEIISELTAHNGLKVFRFSAGQESPERMAELVLAGVREA
jgi:shikimate kinase